MEGERINNMGSKNDKPDEMDECHRLGLTRLEYGNRGHFTGPWTGKQWNEEARRRGYDELVYRLDWSDVTPP